MKIQECISELIQELAPDQGASPSRAFALALSLQSVFSTNPEAPKSGPANSTGPASDELLEALEAVCEAIRVWRTPPFDYDFITSAEAAYHALVAAKATIAQHKGPQS